MDDFIQGDDGTYAMDGLAGVLHLVPQGRYTAARHHNNLPLVTFRTNGMPGVILAEVKQAHPALDNAEERISLGERIKISHRIRVNGLQRYNYDKQVPSRRSNASLEYLSRRKIAYHVAKTVQTCMEQHGDVWMITEDIALRFEDLVLVDLRNVSDASWQPTLAYYV